MAEFYSNIVNFINEMEPILKIVLITFLTLMSTLCFIKVVKTFYNPKKFKFKIGLIILFALLLALTVFFCIHAFF